jgi:type II secretory pathway component PulF
MSLENLLAVVPLGIALLWAMNLAYGARCAGAPDDWLKFCLHTAGWILVLAGSMAALLAFVGNDVLLWKLIQNPYGLGWIAVHFTAVLIFGLIVLATLNRYRQSEGQALLWTLTYAAERGIPLSYAARAFAQERTDEIGSRSWRLADALDAGLPLDAALVAARQPVPANVLAATRIGLAYGRLAEMLEAAITQTRGVDRTLRVALERLLLLAAFFWVLLAITSWVMIRILPTFTRMFYEFQLELPAATKLAVTISETAALFWPVAILLVPAAIAALLVGALYYVGWLPMWLPGVGRLRLRYDGSILLRSLAVAVRQQQPLVEAMKQVEGLFANPLLRSRLLDAIAGCHRGSDPFESLRRARLITRYEQAVLAAAQRVGNLPWALEAMADTAVRRLTQRIRFYSNVMMTIAFGAFSGLVLLFSVAMLQPLADLIFKLA